MQTLQKWGVYQTFKRAKTSCDGQAVTYSYRKIINSERKGRQNSGVIYFKQERKRFLKRW